MATTDLYTVSGSLTPTRHALRFLGGDSDDGIQVDTLAAAIVAANHTKGTITAWIMIPEFATDSFVIFGAGDANAPEFFYFGINNGKLTARSYDGGADRFNIITTSRVIPLHKWTHVAFVQDGNQPDFYVDGKIIPHSSITYTASTELSQWFDDTDGIDGAHLGAADSVSGDAALTREFKGYISEVKIWSGTVATAALTAAQVYQDYEGVSNTTSLLAYYNFDGTVVNTANAGTYDGTIVGALIYCDANEFASRLTFGCGTPLVADSVAITAQNGVGYAFVIQAA